MPTESKDRQALLAFYDFPAEYRVHLEVITGVVFQDGVTVPKKGRQGDRRPIMSAYTTFDYNSGFND